ncbi:MAG: hypothetical protein Q8O95_01355 [bacterium]|nr:hypothetical protein [bacterium]
MKCFHSPAPSLHFPHRLVMFADGPEGMGPQEAGGEGAAGVSEQAAERAAEERRQTAAAAKQHRKEERKMKKRDTKLADIIRSFIQSGGKEDSIALLLSRLLERNCPPSILLSVLCLNYPEVKEVLENYLQEEWDVLPDDTPDIESPQADSMALAQYGKELSEALSDWTKRIFTHASFHPMKSILALAHHHGVDHNMIQLSSLMIQHFFKDAGQDIEFDQMKQFSELFWRDALRRLHQMAEERGLLPEPDQDPFPGNDEEDWDEDDDD